MLIELPENIMSGIPHTHGRFADVFKCIHQGKTFAVKVLRTYLNDNQQEVARVGNIPILFMCWR